MYIGDLYNVVVIILLGRNFVNLKLVEMNKVK